MLASWVLARAVSAYELPGLWQAAADISCAMALVAIRRPAMVVLPVAFLFLVMIFAYALHDAGLINRDTMWAWADLSGYIQLVIILGAFIQGGGRFGMGLGFNIRGRYPHDIFAVPVRISREAISENNTGGVSKDIGGSAANSRPLIESS
jgi:hypothetical protein